MNIYFLVAIAMCQFLLGTVQRAERENIMKENNKCQFLLGTVQRNCKWDYLSQYSYRMCQFLLGTVQLVSAKNPKSFGARISVNSS